MLSILYTISDLLFPPRDTALLLRTLQSTQAQSLFTPGLYEGLHFIASYKNPRVKALIKENKYHHHCFAAKILGMLLARWLQNRYRDTQLVIIPIPLSPTRKQQRGYNQVHEVLKYCHRATVRIDTKSLRRIDTAGTQTNLGRTERFENIRQAFTVDQAALAQYRDCVVLVVDDVVTTGATLRAARASLAPHLHPSCTLVCVALAH